MSCRSWSMPSLPRAEPVSEVKAGGWARACCRRAFQGDGGQALAALEAAQPGHFLDQQGQAGEQVRRPGAAAELAAAFQDQVQPAGRADLVAQLAAFVFDIGDEGQVMLAGLRAVLHLFQPERACFAGPARRAARACGRGPTAAPGAGLRWRLAKSRRSQSSSTRRTWARGWARTRSRAWWASGRKAPISSSSSSISWYRSGWSGAGWDRCAIQLGMASSRRRRIRSCRRTREAVVWLRPACARCVRPCFAG